MADDVRGARAAGVELRPIRLAHGVGEDGEGRHMEIVTRPVRDQATNEGRLLTPATLATATLEYLTYSLEQGR